jgi:hypothetical protein
MSQLRGRVGAPADPAGGEAGEIPFLAPTRI